MHHLLYRYKTISIFIIGLLLISLLFFAVFEQKVQNMINGITVFGTYLSVFGIFISYLQIKSAAAINLETKYAIEKSLEKMNQLILVADLSKANKIIDEIQQYIVHEYYQIALIRMKDLKSILIQAEQNKDIYATMLDNCFTNNLDTLKADIISLHQFTTGFKKSGLNFSKISIHLEELSTTLTAFEHQLKLVS
jgi:hypothetical protein